MTIFALIGHFSTRVIIIGIQIGYDYYQAWSEEEERWIADLKRRATLAPMKPDLSVKKKSYSLHSLLIVI